MKLIITRHGETEENKAGILQGHLPGKLSELGLEQAEKLALRFKDKKIDKIYSSDLARGKDTAEIIAKYHSDTKLIVTKDIRENDLGEMTGKKKTDLGFNKGDLIVGFIESKTGEKNEHMLARAQKFINGLKDKYSNETILIVGHNGINKALLSVVLDKSPNEIDHQKNTSVNIFQIDKNGKAETELYNDTSHLN